MPVRISEIKTIKRIKSFLARLGRFSGLLFAPGFSRGEDGATV